MSERLFVICNAIWAARVCSAGPSPPGPGTSACHAEVRPWQHCPSPHHIPPPSKAPPTSPKAASTMGLPESMADTLTQGAVREGDSQEHGERAQRFHRVRTAGGPRYQIMLLRGSWPTYRQPPARPCRPDAAPHSKQSTDARRPLSRCRPACTPCVCLPPAAPPPADLLLVLHNVLEDDPEQQAALRKTGPPPLAACCLGTRHQLAHLPARGAAGAARSAWEGGACQGPLLTPMVLECLQATILQQSSRARAGMLRRLLRALAVDACSLTGMEARPCSPSTRTTSQCCLPRPKLVLKRHEASTRLHTPCQLVHAPCRTSQRYLCCPARGPHTCAALIAGT